MLYTVKNNKILAIWENKNMEKEERQSKKDRHR